MKVVLDTNVLVSGLLSPHGASAEIVRMTSAGLLQICHDGRILSEYRAVLARPKFNLNRDHLDALLEQIEALGASMVAEPLKKRLPDPDDEPFLEVAIRAKADSLVTFNTKHYPSENRQGIVVSSPGDFLDLYRKRKAAS